MTQFADELRNSRALANLMLCRDLLVSRESNQWEDPGLRELVARIIVVVDDVIRRITLADFDLIPRDLPSILEHHTESLLEFVRSLETSEQPLNIDLGDGHQRVDSVLVHATSLPPFAISRPDESLLLAAERFTQMAVQARTEIDRAVTDIMARAELLSSRISENQDELDVSKSNFQTALDERLTEFRTETQGLVARANEATERLEREITSIQETFRQAQASRDEEFQQTQGSRDEVFHTKLDETVAQVESFRDQARSMLEEVAGASTAEHYSNNRDAQRQAADRWRRIGVGVLILTFLAAVGIFWDSRSIDGELSLAWALARTGVLAVSGGSAAYILRQSGQHRRREEEMSRVANELLLLGPFLNRLEDTDRQALLKEITPLYFRGGLPARNTEPASGRIRGVINRTKAALGSDAEPDDQ